MSTVAKIKPDPEPATLSAAMAAAFAAIEAATKSAANPHFKSKYADISSVIDAIKPALVANGLFFTQRPEPASGGVAVETVVHHASGESMALGTIFVPANKNDAQAYGSALTYARRYALVTAFGVPTEDDDGNAAAKSAPSRGEGHSQNGAVSPPSTPVKGWREPDSIYSAPTKLHAALTLHSAELRRLGEESCFDDLNDYLTSPEYSEFIRVAGKYAPHYLEGGPPLPEEYQGIFQLEQRAKDLIALRGNRAA